MPSRKTAAARKPSTVADRRRALRAAKTPPSGPSLKKAEIDLTQPSARKALSALFPRPENEILIAATPELERVALDYVEARDAEAKAKERKELAGNALCHAIQKNLGVRGDGWEARWDMSKGSIDWTAVAKELAIPDETIAKHRKPETRALTVRETADE